VVAGGRLSAARTPCSPQCTDPQDRSSANAQGCSLTMEGFSAFASVGRPMTPIETAVIGLPSTRPAPAHAHFRSCSGDAASKLARRSCVPGKYSPLTLEVSEENPVPGRRVRIARCRLLWEDVGDVAHVQAPGGLRLAPRDGTLGLTDG